jgi:S1-C subfamily serine protease
VRGGAGVTQGRGFPAHSEDFCGLIAARIGALSEDGIVRLPDAINRIRSSVVQIELPLDDSGLSRMTLGTGFVVGAAARHVLTAKHVVTTPDGEVLEQILVGFPGPNVTTPVLVMRGNFVSIVCSIIDTSGDDDLALIELPEKPFGGWEIGIYGGATFQPPRSATFAQDRCREGTEIAVSGYPLGEPSLVTNAGVLASDFTLLPGPGKSQERLLGDLTANPGNSGGPVYSVQDANVIGILVAGRLTPLAEGEGAVSAGLALIVPATVGAAFLEKNGVEPATSHPKSPTKPPKKRHRR